jgi:hypothetical protein
VTKLCCQKCCGFAASRGGRGGCEALGTIVAELVASEGGQGLIGNCGLGVWAPTYMFRNIYNK